ncbi:4Fe-4S binding protein [Algicella marina]|uniref:4Fe-4S dicluster domain-containing protein n=1 Tax=Algicella marina TaxID=2683284 RepID=A0A6P1SX85_9RHOB|nr:4Fe-4S binding protein [Algicella marina]QHQ35284.1 4Fe-4S dicluster domain-containing protein [Algicella marina]
MSPRLMLCTCEGSQAIDADALGEATGLSTGRVYTNLCGREAPEFRKAAAEQDVVIACGQMAETFAMIADELGLSAPRTFDLRDSAGWSDETAAATPKMAALAAAALIDIPAAPSYDLHSGGTCLILGPEKTAVAAAERLAEHLAVTVAVTDGAPEVLVPDPGYDLITGKLRRAEGSFTKFNVTFDAFSTVLPSGRGTPAMTSPRDGAKASCDILLDLTGRPSLFPAAEKRDGYLRAAPTDQPAIEKAVFEAAQMVGTFEKPLYIRFEPTLCAHSRASKPACSRCQTVCPTGAITSAGETVAINSDICAGCGACASVCPTGAASYEAPTVSNIFRQISTLARAFRSAGGKAPRLLVHETLFGAEAISLAARYGRGLPADTIPLEVNSLAIFGHAEQLAALSAGFVSVDLMAGPKTEVDSVEPELELANAIAGRLLVRLIEPRTPDELEHMVRDRQGVDTNPVSQIVLPIDGRRQTVRLAAKSLHGESRGTIPLPEGAPYGAVVVDTEACTLCLACASLCPTAALSDDPDYPRLMFQQDACIQCGLCTNVCPENAITLRPEMDLSDDALRQTVLKEEEPAECISCGTPFGVQSTIDRIIAQLAGKHPMFSGSDNMRLIQMCDDCRIRAQYHADAQPFASAQRPLPRTTDDYKTTKN